MSLVKRAISVVVKCHRRNEWTLAASFTSWMHFYKIKLVSCMYLWLIEQKIQSLGKNLLYQIRLLCSTMCLTQFLPFRHFLKWFQMRPAFENDMYHYLWIEIWETIWINLTLKWDTLYLFHAKFLLGWYSTYEMNAILHTIYKNLQAW